MTVRVTGAGWSGLPPHAPSTRPEARRAEELGTLAAPAPLPAAPGELPPSPAAAPPRLLQRSQWESRAARHTAAVDALTEAHRRRMRSGTAHPVEDFLFSYYSLRPGQLRRWHPGLDTGLLDAPERRGWAFHRTVSCGRAEAIVADTAAFAERHRPLLGLVTRILAGIQSRPGQFGCFGLHEWAMVFGQAQARRHAAWPLRLGASGTDEVVRTHQLRCTHYDAFRFFTPSARPRNLTQPAKEGREFAEQSGCLHSSMDLYKWAYKLLPIASSDLVLECFTFARHIREIDMRASPYDLSGLGYAAIAVETAAGKAEYVTAQREIAARAEPLRRRVLDVASAALASRPAQAGSDE